MRLTLKTLYPVITSLFVLLSVATGKAQTDNTHHEDTAASVDSLYDDAGQRIYDFVVVARSYGDSIVLRWAPQNAGVWILANHYGWNIYRYKTDRELAENPNDTVFSKLINTSPIRPLTLDEMTRKYDSTHIYVGAAAQALYGESYLNVSENEGMDNYIFRREQEQTQRQAMAYLAAEGHPDAADALGLRFVDRNVVKGEYYTYHIECLIPEDIALTPTKIIDVNCQPFVRGADQSVPNIFFFQNSPYSAFVYWGKNELSGYYVERSDDNGKSWIALNTSPIYGYDPDQDAYEVFGEEVASLLRDNVGMIDSLEPGNKYVYRVKAFDAFGDYAPVRKSESFVMEDLVPPAVPVLDVIVPKENKTCTLEWYVDRIDDDLKGYVVTFSDQPEGPWDNVTDLLPPKTRRWVDEDAYSRGRGYYRVFAVDNSDNVSFSLSQINNIEDDVPPSPPTGLYGVIDTAGFVFLQWNQNPEKDILGYRVYFANQIDHDFIQKTGQRIDDTLFVDSLARNTLNDKVFFYVIAEDNSHNFSKPSDTLVVIVPDLVPPGVAVLKDYTQTDESVTFTWLKSTSEDVAHYQIYRKLENEKQWKCIKSYTPDDLDNDSLIVFTDYPSASSKNYSYCIEVIDNDRLSSGKTGHTTVRFRGASEIEMPLSLKATLNKSKTCAKLDFMYEYNSKKDYYGVIFKSVNDEPAYAVASFRRGENTYTDCNLNANDKVTYHIQMFLGTGKRSQKSQEVIVRP